MKRTPVGEAFTEIVTIGLVVGARLEQAGDALAIPEGQSAARWKVLGRASKKDMTVAEIARSLEQSRQSVLKVADALVEDGLADYVDNPGDRRAKLFTLTSRGRDILRAIQARQRAWADRVGAQLKNEELAQIRAAFERLAVVLSNEEPDLAKGAALER
jgi:DNA-binding MarR family transcriptional regulator